MYVPQGSVRNARPKPDGSVPYGRSNLMPFASSCFAERFEIRHLEPDVIEHAAARRRLRGGDARDIDVDAGQVDGVVAPALAAHAAEVRRVPLLGGRDLICGHVEMDVMRDDRHVDLAIVPLGCRVAAAAVDREAQVRRELVVE